MEQSPPKITRLDHWLSLEEFARASRIQPRSVHLRLKRRAITGIHIDGVLVVDSKLSPPSRKLPKQFKAPNFIQPPEMPRLSKLVQMNAFCKRNNIRGHNIYRDIINGKLAAWYFAEHVFVEDTPELRSYIKAN